MNQVLNADRADEILVEGADFVRADLNKSDSKISTAIANFRKPESSENLCLIYNTSVKGSHWIAILVTKDGRLIIADPLARNRTGFDYISDLYKAIFGKR